MAHFGFEEKESHCLRRDISNLQSCAGSNQLSSTLVSQMPTMKTSEQICLGVSQLENNLDMSSESTNQVEDYSPPIDISTALKSMALMRTWNLKVPLTMPSSAPGLQEDNSTLSPLDYLSKSHEMEADPFKGEMLNVSFQSKYIHFFPLYQDYCLQAVRGDIHRLRDGCLSELINPQNLRSLQSPPNPCSHSSTESLQQRSPGATLYSPQPIRVTSCTLWQDLDEVKASGLLSSLTVGEIRLHESIFELISSEASYLKSLEVAVKHFFASKALKTTLTKMEHHVLFSNIHQVKAASERFLMDLETRLGENMFMSQVGDIVLQHCQDFHKLYVPYVTNMTYQESLVNQLLKRNRNFLHTLKTLEGNPMCQRQTLKSFLVLPFQRITRIKLLLERTLKLTEPDTDSASNLSKAIDAVHEIVTECDEGVKKMKRLEELLCLETRLDFGNIKSVPLVISTRFLILQGPMKLLTLESTSSSGMSFMDIYLHLFNDLLIISSKKDQRFMVLDHALFPAHVSVEHLKTEVLGLPPHSFLLHLSKSQTGHPTAMILVTLTRSDKEVWKKELSSKE
ncbi:rho guanine nucleotide exchange factor 19 [Melanotaenia boesemani]|uniref:rho guanine nucleotide exchange factor 19 n=1 Tax=Melanotaenia boesemani TaxID=1250792 RepID=UPI001C0458F3|nr:rho guanine nucleotide exchange factor 19 [Melanotaenia boesemani]